MNVMKLHAIKMATLALAISAALSNPASATIVDINFDNVASGSGANSAVAGSGISFAYAVPFLVDEYSNPIPGTNFWQPDPTAPAVTVSNPNDPTTLPNYGPAPSAPNALDAIWQPVLMHFSQAVKLNSFAFTLDNSTKGNPGNWPVLFLNSNHQTIGQVDSFQSVSGYLGSTTNPLNGVQDVLLASGAYYDNFRLSVIAIPEPEEYLMMLIGAGMVGFQVKRKKNLPSCRGN
jgi:hypothetical protein